MLKSNFIFISDIFVMRAFFVFIIFFNFAVCAHQPKLINYASSQDNPHEVFDPEISKAYYAKLTGQAHYYQINSEEDFLFYVGILSPKVSDTYKWLSIDVLDENNIVIYQANGSNFNWKAWYEPYARDWYWKGPEIGSNVNLDIGFKRSFLLDAGTYLIKVYNDDNIGHYSLAVGEAEFFWCKYMGTNLHLDAYTLIYRSIYGYYSLAKI